MRRVYHTNGRVYRQSLVDRLPLTADDTPVVCRRDMRVSNLAGANRQTVGVNERWYGDVNPHAARFYGDPFHNLYFIGPKG